MAKKPAKKPTSAAQAKAAATPIVKAPYERKTAAQRPAFSKYVSRSNLRSLSVGAFIAELIGTFALVLVYMTVQGSQLYLLFAYAALVLVFARVSGPHLNPAITLGLWAVRHISGMRAITFVVAQILGAMLALIVANALVPDAVNQLTGQPEAGQVFTAPALPTEDDGRWRVLAVEAMGMLIFSMGVAAAFLSRYGLAAKALAIGGAYMVGLLIIQGGQILNPAIAVGLQAVKLELWPLAIYVLTPIAASIVGMSLYRFVQRDADRNDGTRDEDTEVNVTKVRI